MRDFVLPAGPPPVNTPVQGPAGAGYGGGSSTPLAVGLGQKTLAVPDGLAYAVGSRIRVGSGGAAQHWFEGTVLSNGGGSLVVDSDITGGTTATRSDWVLSVAGRRSGSVTTSAGAPSGGSDGDTNIRLDTGDVQTKSGGAWGAVVGNLKPFGDATIYASLVAALAAVSPGVNKVLAHGGEVGTYASSRPATWTYSASQPAHARKRQAADGRWFENTERRIDPRNLRFAIDADDTNSFSRAAAIADTVLELAGDYTVNNLVTYNRVAIIAQRGATITYGGTYSATAGTANEGTYILATYASIYVHGVTWVAPISVVKNVYPTCGKHIWAIYPTSYDALATASNKNVYVEKCSFVGGQTGLSVQSADNLYVGHCDFRYCNQFGVVPTETCRDVLVEHCVGQRIGYTELVRIGTSGFSSRIERLTISRCKAVDCGVIDMQGGAGSQEGYDLFCRRARVIELTDCIADGCGAGLVELKWSASPVGVSEITNVRINNNHVINSFSTKGVAYRLAVSTALAPPVRSAEIKGNRFVWDAWTKNVDGAGVTISTTSGSRDVNFYVPGHGGRLGEDVLITDWLTTGGLGGIPTWDIVSRRQVTTIVDSDNFKITCETPATSTASTAMTGAVVRCRFAERALATDPLGLTNGSYNMVVTDPTHTMVAGNFVRLIGAVVSGFTAWELNHRYQVQSTTATTYTVQLLRAFTGSTGSYGGSAVKVDTRVIDGGATGIWLGATKNVNIANNDFEGGCRCFLFDPSTLTHAGDASQSATAASQISEIDVVGNACRDMQYGFYLVRNFSHAVTVSGNKFKTTNSTFYQDVSSTGPTLRGWNISGNTFESNGREGNGYIEIMRLGSMVDCRIVRNTIVGDGYAIRQYSNAAASKDASSGNLITGNTIDVSNPDTGRHGVYLTEGAWTVRSNDILTPSGYQGVCVSGASVAANDNIRGISSAMPTANGGLGDVFLASNPALLGVRGWVCVVAGTTTNWRPIGIVGEMRGSATIDLASVAAGATATSGTTITVTGARSGDFVTITYGGDAAGLQLTGYVSANDTVTVRATNPTSGAIDLASASVEAVVRRAA